jgi:hypothetical protein
MEALNALFRLADAWGILSSHHAPVIRYRLSLYADDLVIFVIPTEQDQCCVRAVLQAFAEASGLCSNISKSQFTPIQCTEVIIQLVPCQRVNFPFRYLGVPLSVYQLKRCDLQPLVDAVKGRLPSWKAGKLSRPGRTTLVKSTLSAIPVHISIAVKLCPDARRCIDKIRRGFIWCRTSSASGGHCMVAWPKVTMPIELGEVGVPDRATLCACGGRGLPTSTCVAHGRPCQATLTALSRPCSRLRSQSRWAPARALGFGGRNGSMASACRP